MKSKLRLGPSRARSEAADKAEVVVNPAVANMLSPTSFTEESSCFQVGSSWRKVEYVSDYMQEVAPNYARPLFSEQGSITTFVMEPADKSKLKKAIDNADARHGVALVQGSSASNMDEEMRGREAGYRMLQLMGDDGEKFFDTMVMQTVVGGERYEDLEAASKSVTSKTGNGQALTLSTCDTKQREAFDIASPYWSAYKKAFARYGRNLPSSTIAAALPFQNNDIDDGTGIDLGWTEPDHNVVRLETTRTTFERPNCNIWVSGASGQGKTYACTKILNHEYAMGAAVIVIDPERQFSSLCRYHNGYWINAGGGVKKTKKGVKGYCVSPLQPRVGITREDGANEEFSTDDNSVLRATLFFFHGWAELAWSTTSDDTDLLDKGLIRAYAEYGIDFSTTAMDLVEDRYPTMTDLKEAYEKLAEEAGDERDKAVFRRFARKAEQCSEDGTYGNLWGYRTNVDINNDFVVFDTYELTGAEDHIRTAQMFSILSWIWSRACVSRVTKQFLRIFADEGHLLFNGGSKESVSTLAASYVGMISKRCRKYSCGLGVATQALSDVLDPAVRRYGEGLITNSCYRIFFSTSATDLELLSSVAKLTPEVERKIGTKFRVGDCLVCAGNTKVQAHIEPVRFIDEMLSL